MHEYKYPRPAVSCDLVVMRSANLGREILLIQRLKDPFADSWALPGGFMNIDETLEQAAVRELKEETGLTMAQESLEQIGAYSAVDRDPRGRVITVAFLCELEDGQEAVAADDAKSARWLSLDELPQLAFDHSQIIEDAFNGCQG